MTKGPDAPQALVLVNQKRGALEAAIPKTMVGALSWERIVQSVGMALNANETLRKCAPATVYQSVLQIVGKGLDLGMDGHAYLVPFYDTKSKSFVCTAMIGSRGKMELAYRSGRVDRLLCNVVHMHDEFDVDMASGKMKHRPAIYDEPGETVAAYARVWLKGVAEPVSELMTRREFQKIIDAASAKNNGKLSPAYTNWPDEMFRRSVLNRLLKRIPTSRDLADVLRAEFELEEGTTSSFSDLTDLGGPTEKRDVVDAGDVEAELEREKAAEQGQQGGQPDGDKQPKPAAKPDEGGTRTRPSKTDQELLFEKLGGETWKTPVLVEKVAGLLKEALDITRISQERVDKAVKSGDAAGLWELDSTGRYLYPPKKDALPPEEEREREPGEEG